MAKGYVGIILRVDFTTGRIERAEMTEVMSYRDGMLCMVIRGMEN